jgi:hypothetical protein
MSDQVTGDITNNLEKLRSALKSVRFPSFIDVDR